MLRRRLLVRYGCGVGRSQFLRDSLRRLSWGVADQALSSLTNFGLGLLVARSTTQRDFGAFAIAFTTYTLAIGVSRALSSEPLVVRYSDVPARRWERGAIASSGTALALGVLIGCLLLIAGVVNAGLLGRSLFFFGLVLAPLMLQDSWRFVFFADGRGKQAFLNDLVWGLVLLPALALAITIGDSTLGALIFAWGVAGGIAAVFGCFQARLIPRPAKALGWLREHRELAPRFLGEFAALNGSTHIATYGIGIVAGLTSVGAIRGATLLFGPFFVVYSAVNIVAIPEGVRLLRRSVRSLERGSAVLGLGLAVGAIAWAAIVYAIPRGIGTQLLGPSWPEARRVVLPTAAWVASSGIVTGGLVGLRSLGAARRSLKARLFTAPLIIAGGIGGAVAGGSVGAVTGMAIANSVGAVYFWLQLMDAVRRYREGPPPQAGEEGPARTEGAAESIFPEPPPS
jgi:O-antigen/teichoic acid export membrane protein